MKIAVLENDTRAAQMLEDWLRAAGHVATLFDSATAFAHELRGALFDAAILGTVPSGAREADICARPRDRSGSMPLLRVLNRGSEQDIVAALQAGADDCMAVARQAELLARLDAITRRVRPDRPATDDVMTFGNLSVDLKNRVILRDGVRVMLTPKTYNLAVFLLSNSGKLLSRPHLLEQIWGHDKSATTRTLDTHISRLRTVLGLTPEFGWQLQSVYQHGYRLDIVDASMARVRKPKNEPCEQVFT